MAVFLQQRPSLSHRLLVNSGDTILNYLQNRAINKSVSFFFFYKKVYAIKADGTEKWTLLTEGRFPSSPAIGFDGTIYMGATEANKLYAINPDGTVKWAFQTGGTVHSSPSIGSDGTIYVGSGDGNIYAINSASGGLADSPWPMFRHDVRHTARSHYETPEAGDINDDDSVDLADVILALKIIAGMGPDQVVYEAPDVNGDRKIGLAEVVYILQKVSALR